jgi:NCAIR mutase (PurE)-related protein
MRPEEVKALLERLENGQTTVGDALLQLRRAPIEDLGFARLDTHRELRQGFPEAIYAEGKTAPEVVAIARRLIETTTSAVLATRCPEATMDALTEAFPEARIHRRAGLVVLRSAVDNLDSKLGTVSVLCAGTSDLPVAEEAAVTAEALGAEVKTINDIGVAGIHRLVAVEGELQHSDVVIVAAGMDGALPSLVGGIVAAPVIAVPTSVGYGASFGGLSALLAMLNSCAAGVSVVNIDNGFGAALAAMRILGNKDR